MEAYAALLSPLTVATPLSACVIEVQKSQNSGIRLWLPWLKSVLVINRPSISFLDSLRHRGKLSACFFRAINSKKEFTLFLNQRTFI